MHEVDPPLASLSLLSACPNGFRSGLLTKLGGLRKNWKVRHFSLTWNCLSYYNPSTPTTARSFLSHIPLSSCTKVELVSVEKPYTFHLITTSRTYILQAPTNRDRQLWIEALEAMILIHNPKLTNLPNMPHIKRTSFHVLRILNGTYMLSDTHDAFRQVSERMCFALFDLLRSFTSQINDRADLQKYNTKNEIHERCATLNRVVQLLKEEIPPEHRVHSEEANFDISVEQRVIAQNLKYVCGDVQIFEYPFERLEEDLRPVVFDVIKYALK